MRLKHSTPEEDAAFRIKFRAAMQNTEQKDWPLPWPTLRADHKRLETLRDKPEITADEYVAAAEAALVSFVSTRIARLEREELGEKVGIHQQAISKWETAE